MSTYIDTDPIYGGWIDLSVTMPTTNEPTKIFWHPSVKEDIRLAVEGPSADARRRDRAALVEQWSKQGYGHQTVDLATDAVIDAAIREAEADATKATLDAWEKQSPSMKARR